MLRSNDFRPAARNLQKLEPHRIAEAIAPDATYDIADGIAYPLRRQCSVITFISTAARLNSISAAQQMASLIRQADSNAAVGHALRCSDRLVARHTRALGIRYIALVLAPGDSVIVYRNNLPAADS